MKISLNKIIAIGDNFNDETMILNAGIGIAMENADSHIKSISDYITASNEDNGVSQAIYKFF